jgi:nucleoside-diphosphate-sugar epimerase
MFTILGAGGAIGNELVKQLAARSEAIPLVSRNAKLVPGATEAIAADLSNLDDTLRAVSGSRTVFLVVGLKYEVKVWRELWPRVMHNASEAANRANARLIFFDNVYMYWKVNGPMTEETPFRPCSKESEIRAADRHYASKRHENQRSHGAYRALRRLLWPARPHGHPQCSGVRQIGQGHQSELAWQ